MGRLQPSRGLPPAGFLRAARAKKAKATINQLIPSLLSTHPRARRGIEAAELIVVDQETGTLRGASGEKLQAPPAPAGPVSCDSKSSHRNASSKTNASQTHPPPSPRITLVVADTLSAARALAEENPNPEFKPSNPTDSKTTQESSPSPLSQRVAILNMASPLNPGGGFVNGATSQEESLCMRTTLLPSLRDHYYRLPDLGAIYTPDVLVFRSDDDDAAADVLEKKDRWFVDCISAAMLRNPETEADSSGRRRYVRDKDRQLVLDKMKMVMRICRARGVRRVVLGAWGCGAYGNPVGEVAAAWRKVLLPRTTDGGKGKKAKGERRGSGGGSGEDWRDVVEEIVFAVKDAGMADAFATSFGEGLVREELAGSIEEEEEGGDHDDDPEEANRAELRARISELEVRIQASTNPQLKQGLHSILASLVSQLPPGDDNKAL
ncbi:hypothetical protein ACRALDRAFT_2141748 [Sodiomyces alcalophilus JCM 7366]|uniref:uncharacterized protein n=1 Tax=Sodiomyces alcalophilus JCM 7366 TaxID=591952 RepID=UPI0039B39DAE